MGGGGKLPGALRYPPPKIKKLGGFGPLFFPKGPNYQKKRKKSKRKNFLSVLEGPFQA